MTVSLDMDDPAVAVSNLTDGQWISTNSIDIRGTVSDTGGSGVKTVEYSLDEGVNWTAADVSGGNS